MLFRLRMLKLLLAIAGVLTILELVDIHQQMRSQSRTPQMPGTTTAPQNRIFSLHSL